MQTQDEDLLELEMLLPPDVKLMQENDALK